MLKRFAGFGFGLMLIGIVFKPVMAEKTIKFGFSTDYYSKYIWRGQNINDKSVLQPSISASVYGFTGSIWGNLDLTNKSKTAPDNAWEFSEFDYTLDYSGQIPDVSWLSFSVGVIYYRFPNTVYEPTNEIYGGLSFTNVPLSPYFKWYRDVDEFKGSYFQFGIGHTFEKAITWKESFYCDLVLGACLGWGNSAYNKGYFSVPNCQSNDFTLSAGLPINIGAWTVKPSVNYATMLSGSIREATDKSDNVWTGVGISTSF